MPSNRETEGERNSRRIDAGRDVHRVAARSALAAVELFATLPINAIEQQATFS
jgi:hypothetical protein